MGGKKVLITGGAGFIGKTLSNYLVKKKFNVLVVDDLSSGTLKGMDKKVLFKKIDISNLTKFKKIFNKFKPDIVYHLAAHSSRDPKDTKVLENITTTLNTVLCGIDARPTRFVFSSSASVYGEANKFPTPESAPLRPINNYGLSKATSEMLIKLILGPANIPYTIFRFSNVYGPDQRFDNEGGIVSIIIHKIQRNEKISIRFGGKQTRDFVYVDDVVDALYKSMLSSKSFTANVSTGKETSISNLLDLIRAVLHKEIDVEYKPCLTPEIKRSALTNLKIKKILNWKPSISLSEGIQLTINK